ncbi:MAG: monofunctional biosynthetic peptidoglycan transglycosylase [Acidobacteria bacterium]|nr:monofunctional biosynthetic peptidoglycan transglycosylase [Acidobacteriota bacterium]
MNGAASVLRATASHAEAKRRRDAGHDWRYGLGRTLAGGATAGFAFLGYYDHISPDLRRAVLIAEDDAFWRHEVVDLDQLQQSLELDWARGRLVRGGSTITQQLAKNLYLSPSKNPLRKLRELIIARRLEAELTKTRILELYLNVIEWGDGIYGAEAAARAYFGKPASDLDPGDAALLAGAIANPRLLNPAKPTSRLRRRQQLILKRMLSSGAGRRESAATSSWR